MQYTKLNDLQIDFPLKQKNPRTNATTLSLILVRPSDLKGEQVVQNEIIWDTCKSLRHLSIAFDVRLPIFKMSSTKCGYFKTLNPPYLNGKSDDVPWNTSPSCILMNLRSFPSSSEVKLAEVKSISKHFPGVEHLKLMNRLFYLGTEIS